MRLGIVGCGLIGRKRAIAARKCGVTVSCVVDVNRDRADSLAELVEARPEQDWRSLLGSDVDAINIAVTHDMLAPIAIAALQAGKHVLIEKPAGRNKEEVGRVMKTARTAGLVAKTGFNHRFHPAVFKAKELIESGAIGAVMYVRGRYGHGGRPGYDKEWRCQRELSGGGELVDQGSHLIDLSRWLMGDLKLAFAATPHLFWDIEVDDNCFLALTGRKGEVAWLHASWSEWKNTFSLEIAGRNGKLSIDGLGGSYGNERLSYYKMLPQMGPPETTIWEYPFEDKSWEAEFHDFLAAVEGRPSCMGDISDAFALWGLIEDAYRQD